MGGHVSTLGCKCPAPSMDKDTTEHPQASAWNWVLCTSGTPPQPLPITYLLLHLQGTGKHLGGFVGFVLFCFVLGWMNESPMTWCFLIINSCSDCGPSQLDFLKKKKKKGRDFLLEFPARITRTSSLHWLTCIRWKPIKGQLFLSPPGKYHTFNIIMSLEKTGIMNKHDNINGLKKKSNFFCDVSILVYAGFISLLYLGTTLSFLTTL